MIAFRNLFSFTKQEISSAFDHARVQASCHGLKLLKAPIVDVDHSSPTRMLHGKLLVITPRASGKAHDRVLIKRRFKAIFYEEKLHQQPMIWILLIYKQGTLYSFDYLKSFLCHAIKKPSN